MFLQGFTEEMVLHIENAVYNFFWVKKKRNKLFQKGRIVTAVQNKIKQVAGNINNISLLVIDCNTLTKETSFFLILQSSLKNQDKGPFGGYSSWKSITKYYFSNPCFFIYLYFVRIQPSLSRKNLSSPCNTSALDWSPACT